LYVLTEFISTVVPRTKARSSKINFKDGIFVQETVLFLERKCRLWNGSFSFLEQQLLGISWVVLRFCCLYVRTAVLRA